MILTTQAEDFFGTIIAPLKPYRLEINYDAGDLGLVQESTLELLYFDGNSWHLERSVQYDAAANKVTAEPDHFGSWALVGSAKWQTNLPIISSHALQTDLVLKSMEITQAVQSLDNSVPLVNGRPAVVRVDVRTNSYNPVDEVSLILEGSRSGSPLPGSPMRVDNWTVFNQAVRGNLSHSFNVHLPAKWSRVSAAIPLPVNQEITAVGLWEEGRLIAERKLLNETAGQPPASISIYRQDDSLTLNWSPANRLALIRFKPDNSSQLNTLGIDNEDGKLTIPKTPLLEGAGTFEVNIAGLGTESLTQHWSGI